MVTPRPRYARFGPAPRVLRRSTTIPPTRNPRPPIMPVPTHHADALKSRFRDVFGCRGREFGSLSRGILGVSDGIESPCSGRATRGSTPPDAGSRSRTSPPRRSRWIASMVKAGRLPCVWTLDAFDFSFQPTSASRSTRCTTSASSSAGRTSSSSARPGSARHTWQSAWPSPPPRTAARSTSEPLTDLVDSLEEAMAAGWLNRRPNTLTHPALLVVDENACRSARAVRSSSSSSSTGATAAPR